MGCAGLMTGASHAPRAAALHCGNDAARLHNHLRGTPPRAQGLRPACGQRGSAHGALGGLHDG